MKEHIGEYKCWNCGCLTNYVDYTRSCVNCRYSPCEIITENELLDKYKIPINDVIIYRKFIKHNNKITLYFYVKNRIWSIVYNSDIYSYARKILDLENEMKRTYRQNVKKFLSNLLVKYDKTKICKYEKYISDKIKNINLDIPHYNLAFCICRRISRDIEFNKK